MVAMRTDMRVLIIAYYFPPESSSGAFRPLYFANHLTQMGCRISVLTCNEQYYLAEQPTDYALLDKLSSDIGVIRTRVTRPREALISLKKRLTAPASKGGNEDASASQQFALGDVHKSTIQKIKDFITDSLAIPDPHAGWLPWAIYRGVKIITSQKIDVIWATGSPWTCFLVGAFLKKITGKPLVLDYRDPWGANPNMRLKNKYVASLEKKIEKAIVTKADLITANTKELRENFLVRFSGLRKRQVIALPNGFEEFIESQICKKKALTLSHAGALYFSRNPINLLKAAVSLIEKGAIPVGKLKIKFVGGISIDDRALDALLDSPELKNVVEVYPRMALDKAIEHQLASDVLFLLQPGFPLQIPRKLYEYISLRKPILAITDREGATARVIEENHFGIVVPNTESELEHVLKKLWLDWQDGNLPKPPLKNSEFFLNSNLSRILHNELASLAGAGVDDTIC